MYAYIKGQVTKILTSAIELECNNIGYEIKMANPYVFHEEENVVVYLYQKVSDDVIELYGFKYEEEKELFIRLISVSGIGPKSALSILATGDVKGVINAIDCGDARYLTRFPGIGQKASQQIILDLKGKIDFAPRLGNNIMEVKEALMALGYKQKEIDKAVLKLDEHQSVDELIKQALKALLK